MTNTVSIKAKAGRIARVSPNGSFIPHDKYVTVEKTSYVNRLIHVHQDVELEPKPVKQESDSGKPTKKKQAKET